MKEPKKNQTTGKSTVYTDARPSIVGRIGQWFKRHRRLMTYLLLAGLVTISLALVALKMVNERSKFAIGDTTISQADINRYAKSIDNYKAANKDAAFNQSSKKEALDDLVMNAALIKEAKAKGKSLSEAELREVYRIPASDKNYQAAIEDIKASSKPIYYESIISENLKLSQKLQSDLILNRSIFFVAINFDGPAMRSVSDKAQRSKLHEEARNKLNSQFMPMFKQQQPMETIAGKAQINYTTEQRTGAEYAIFQNDPLAASAVFFKHYIDREVPDMKYAVRNVTEKDGTQNIARSFKDLDNVDYGVDVADLRDSTAEINKLKNVGDYTDVFASKTGNYMIARLEAKSGGEYDTFQALLEQYKQQYVPGSIKVSESESPLALLGSAFKRVYRKMPFINVEKVNASNHCGGHYGTGIVAIVNADNIYQRLDVGTVRISQARGTGNDCGTGQSATGRGSASITINCYSGQVPTVSLVSLDDGYIVTGGGSSGWDQWVNSNQAWQAYYHVDRIPSPTPTPTPTTTPPNQPSDCSISVSPSNLPVGGGTVTVSWSSSNTRSGSISPFPGQLRSNNQEQHLPSRFGGSATGNITQSTTFTGSWTTHDERAITCSDTVTVGPPTTTTSTPPPPPQSAGYYPYIRVYGNDVIVGSAFKNDADECVDYGGNSRISTRVYQPSRDGYTAGAGGQFAIFAPWVGPRKYEPSGAVTMSNNLQARGAWGADRHISNDLIFGNTYSESRRIGDNEWYIHNKRAYSGGGSGYAHCNPNYFKDFRDRGAPVSPSGTLSSLDPSLVNPIPNGARKTLVVDGDLYIDRNIQYASTNWSNVSQIPNVSIIVKGNINISKDVTQIDGLLVAQPVRCNWAGSPSTPCPENRIEGGSINSCAEPSGPLPLSRVQDECKRKLTINGAVISHGANWFRSLGSVFCPTPSPIACTPAAVNEPADSGNIAEVINFSPEMYLAPLNGQVHNTPLNRFDSVTSLPPVF